jgi:hypothetical protein
MMREELKKPAAGSILLTDPISDDGIPVLREIVNSGQWTDIPTLDPSEAIASPVAASDSELSPERLAVLTDTLQLTLNRELDYAIDGAVYEWLRAAMEEVAASVKKQVQTQLEQKLPELIEQTLRKEN